MKTLKSIIILAVTFCISVNSFSQNSGRVFESSVHPGWEQQDSTKNKSVKEPKFTDAEKTKNAKVLTIASFTAITVGLLLLKINESITSHMNKPRKTIHFTI